MALENTQDLEAFGGKYEILAELGQGGMGRVYKVKHRNLEVLRVIKVMRSGLSSDESLRDRFVQEARKLCRLDHPNVARLWDFDVNDQGTMYMVIEYIEGQNLADYLEMKGPPELPQALDIAIQSLDAIACLHKEEWIHRDLSPDNLMLTQEPDGTCRVKLIDLGIAKDLEGGKGHTTPGHFVGKIRYASPEQLSLRPLTKRSDVYSFGICLYELVTGRFPIPGNDMTSLIASHTTGKKMSFAVSDPHDRVPRKLRDIVMKAMARDAANRFSSATEFRQALEHLRVQLGVSQQRTMIEIIRPPVPRASSPGQTQEEIDQQFPPDQTTEGRRLDRTLTEIRALLDEGSLVEAERALDQARRRHGSPSVFRELVDRLDRLKADNREEEARELMRGAERLLQEGDYRPAIRLLERVRELAPHTPGLDERLEEVTRHEEARQRREALAQARRSLEDAARNGPLAEARAALDAAQQRFGDDDLRDLAELLDEREAAERAAAVRARVEQITPLLDSGALEEADRALAEAEARLGDHEAFTALRRRVEQRGAEEDRARRKIDDLLAQARMLADSRRPEDALPRLDEARSLGADHAAVAAVESRAREVIRERRQIDDLVAAAGDYLGTGDLGTAKSRIENAVRLDGGDPNVLALRRKIDEAIEEHGARVKRAAELLVVARQRLDADDLEEALRLVDEAHAIDPQNDELPQLQKKIRKRSTEQHQRKRDADRLATEAQRLLESGDVDGALEQVEAALELEPDNALATLVASNAVKERELTRAASAEAKSVVELLQRNQLEQADRALTEALKQFGRRGGLPQLRNALEEAKRQQVDARLSELIEEARARGVREDFRGALEVVDRALAISPGYREAEVLRVRWTKALEQRGEQERAKEARKREIAEVLEEANHLIEDAQHAGERTITELEQLLASAERARQRLGPVAASDVDCREAPVTLGRLEAAIAGVTRAVQRQRRNAIQEKLNETEVLCERGRHLRALRRVRELQRSSADASSVEELRPRIRQVIESSRRGLRLQVVRWGGAAVVVVLLAVAGYPLWQWSTGQDPITQRVAAILALPETSRPELTAKIGLLSDLENEVGESHPLAGRIGAEKDRVADLRDVQDSLNNTRLFIDKVLSGETPAAGPVEVDIVESNVESIALSLAAFEGDPTADRLLREARAELERLRSSASP